MIKITWLGHSCFKFEAGGHSIVIDPYTGVPGYPALETEAGSVLTSHDHADHSFTEAVRIVDEAGEDPFTVSTIDCWHDDKHGSLRGPNRITIFEAGGVRIAHFGDVGEKLSDDVISGLKGLDAAMIPAGGYYTIDGRQAAELMKAVDPAVTIPMHYRWDGHGYDEISEVNEFVDAVTDRPVIMSDGNSLEIRPGKKDKRVAVLSFGK